jgi:hypothetical protein
MKELWIALHNRKIDEYMDSHPNADWSDAYEKCIPTDDEFRDYLADKVDSARQQYKDNR